MAKQNAPALITLSSVHFSAASSAKIPLGNEKLSVKYLLGPPHRLLLPASTFFLIPGGQIPQVILFRAAFNPVLYHLNLIYCLCFSGAPLFFLCGPEITPMQKARMNEYETHLMYYHYTMDHNLDQFPGS